MTWAEWIAGLRRHANSLGITLTEDMLNAANSIYDGIELLKASGFSDQCAWREFAFILDRVDAGDVTLSLEIASRAADLLERLVNIEGAKGAGYRETLRQIIDHSIDDAHGIAHIGLRSSSAWRLP